VLLGCAGMTDMVRACEDAVGTEAQHSDGQALAKVRRINITDGVEIGVDFLYCTCESETGFE
jgi:hypothetical protein